MGVKLLDSLAPQPPQAKFRGNRDPEHPWRKLAAKAAREAVRRREQFVCVSCGDLGCVGGECGSSWDDWRK